MPAPPRHPTPPFNNLHPHDRKNTAVMGISISHMSIQSPGKSSRGTDLLSPLRLYQQHNDLFEQPVRVRPNPRRTARKLPSKLGGLVLYEEGCVMNNTFTGHNTFIILFPT